MLISTQPCATFFVVKIFIHYNSAPGFSRLPDVGCVPWKVLYWHPLTLLQSSSLHSGKHFPPQCKPNLPRGQGLQFLPKNPSEHSTYEWEKKTTNIIKVLCYTHYTYYFLNWWRYDIRYLITGYEDLLLNRQTCYCPYNKQTTFVGDADFDADHQVRVGGLRISISD